MRRSVDIVELIAEKQPALLQAVDSDGDTPLHNAVRGEHAAVVQYLVERGADVTLKNGAGQTPRDAGGKDIPADVAAALDKAS